MFQKRVEVCVVEARLEMCVYRTDVWAFIRLRAAEKSGHEHGLVRNQMSHVSAGEKMADAFVRQNSTKERINCFLDGFAAANDAKKIDFQMVGNRVADLILHLENILNLTLVAL